MEADLEQQIRAFAIGRVGLGAAAIIAPGQMLKRWFGKGADSPVSRALTRFVGGRDVALGLGTLFALSHGSPVRGWLEAGMVADAGDMAATLVAAKHLPRVAAVGSVFAAAGGVVYARRLISQLEAASASEPESESDEPGAPELEPVT
ncbi:MAG: hypothetical protein ACRD12_20525 [Acidimicrobiales bacterium]